MKLLEILNEAGKLSPDTIPWRSRGTEKFKGTAPGQVLDKQRQQKAQQAQQPQAPQQPVVDTGVKITRDNVLTELPKLIQQHKDDKEFVQGVYRIVGDKNLYQQKVASAAALKSRASLGPLQKVVYDIKNTDWTKVTPQQKKDIKKLIPEAVSDAFREAKLKEISNAVLGYKDEKGQNIPGLDNSGRVVLGRRIQDIMTGGMQPGTSQVAKSQMAGPAIRRVAQQRTERLQKTKSSQNTKQPFKKWFMKNQQQS